MFLDGKNDKFACCNLTNYFSSFFSPLLSFAQLYSTLLSFVQHQIVVILSGSIGLKGFSVLFTLEKSAK